MIDPGPATVGLDITTASVQADPGLLSADPAMMATAARAFSSAAHQIEATGRASAQASARLSTNWWGKGKQGFDAAATKANGRAQVAAGALAGASGALLTLSVQISAAQAMARQAQGMAADSAQAASALQSAYAASAQQAVQALPAGATPAQTLAARVPTAAQSAQANAISADAAQATHMMAQANTMARQAWSQAAAAFDAVTAQAPSVQDAVLAARAKAAKAGQGGGFWSGVGNLALGGVAWAGDVVLGGVDVAQGGVDPLTDAGTVADGAEAADLTGTGIADLSGGASASAVAAAEEEAAANVVVDGAKVDSQVADDATTDAQIGGGGSANSGDGMHIMESPGRTFVGTPQGTTYDIPEGWVSRTADNGRGIVFQEPGSVGNANSIRIMEPTAKYPSGYVRYYNQDGQPLDVFGKPGPPSETHIPQDYQGPWPGWP